MAKIICEGVARIGLDGGLLGWIVEPEKIPDCSDVRELVDLGFATKMIVKPCSAGDHCVAVLPTNGAKAGADEILVSVKIEEGTFKTCIRCFVTYEMVPGATEVHCAACAARLAQAASK